MHRDYIDIRHNTIIDYIKEVFTFPIQVDLCIIPDGNFTSTEERIVLNEYIINSDAWFVRYLKFNNRYMEML